MTHTPRTRPTTAQRAGWAAAGAAATLAAVAGVGLAWARDIQRNEQYGTHQRQHHDPHEQARRRAALREDTWTTASS